MKICFFNEYIFFYEKCFFNEKHDFFNEQNMIFFYDKIWLFLCFFQRFSVFYDFMNIL